MAKVLTTSSRPKSKWRPLPLDTVVSGTIIIACELIPCSFSSKTPCNIYIDSIIIIHWNLVYLGDVQFT